MQQERTHTTKNDHYTKKDNRTHPAPAAAPSKHKTAQHCARPHARALRTWHPVISYTVAVRPLSYTYAPPYPCTCCGTARPARPPARTRSAETAPPARRAPAAGCRPRPTRSAAAPPRTAAPPAAGRSPGCCCWRAARGLVGGGGEDRGRGARYIIGSVHSGVPCCGGRCCCRAARGLGRRGAEALGWHQYDQVIIVKDF